MWTARAVVSSAVALALAGASADAAEPLVLEGKIPLGQVEGRIDHLAFDPGRQRLIVAELGNNTVGVVDLAGRKVAGRIVGLNEPQGVAYVPTADLIYVATAGDGYVRWFQCADLARAGALKLGEDADNIRVDPGANRLVVGYGGGSLAILDANAGRKLDEIALPGHPESFQLEASGSRIFVNVPEAHRIAVVDRAERREIASWGLPRAESNFPMALDEAGRRLFVVYRKPPTLAVLDIDRGAVTAELPSCKDADDVFVDEKRKRLYVSCGEGVVAVFEQDGSGLREMARVPTSPGARTSLFVPQLDRLFVAARAQGGEKAAIWTFRPAP